MALRATPRFVLDLVIRTQRRSRRRHPHTHQVSPHPRLGVGGTCDTATMTRTRTFGTMAPITHAPRSSTEPSRWAWFLPGRKGRGHLKRSRSLTIAVLDLRSLAAGGSGREPRQDIQDSFW